MAKKKPDHAATLEALLAAGDFRAAGDEARRLAAVPEGAEAARGARARLGPERGAAVAAVLGVLLLAAIAFLGLGHR